MGPPKKTVAPEGITSAQSTSQPQLTPRSSEACRRTGVDPRELVPLPPEVFKEPGQSDELQQLKFHTHSRCIPARSPYETVLCRHSIIELRLL